MRKLFIIALFFLVACEKKGIQVSFFDASNSLIKKYNCELSDTEDKRQLGLMYRQTLEQDDCMLFVFPSESPRGFWMKNTYVSLDIIYLNSKIEIVSIARNTAVLSEDPIPSKGPAQYVVELKAGESEKFAEGTKVQILPIPSAKS